MRLNFSRCSSVIILSCALISSAATVDRSTRFVCWTSAASNPAFLACNSADAVFSDESATAKPAITQRRNPQTASIATPTITMRWPRSMSALYRVTRSAKISGLKSVGGMRRSADAPILSPINTTAAPTTLKNTSTQNQGDEMTFTTKFIYLFVFSLPFLILFTSIMAIIWHWRPSKRMH